MSTVMQTIGVIVLVLVAANVVVFGPLLVRYWREERDRRVEG